MYIHIVEGRSCSTKNVLLIILILILIIIIQHIQKCSIYSVIYIIVIVLVASSNSTSRQSLVVLVLVSYQLCCTELYRHPLNYTASHRHRDIDILAITINSIQHSMYSTIYLHTNTNTIIYHTQPYSYTVYTYSHAATTL